MEDTHKKAVFASSLIKNVISKKMQFEQERKMERGEIKEQHQMSSMSFTYEGRNSHQGSGNRELLRQNSRFSESSSDDYFLCMEEWGDIVKCRSRSYDTLSESQSQVTAAPTPADYLEPLNDAGIYTEKSQQEDSENTLRLSQNLTFRCWKEEEKEFRSVDEKNYTTTKKQEPSDRPVDNNPAGVGQLNKMSQLFVPSFKNLSQSTGFLPNEDHEMQSDNKLRIPDFGREAASKSLEFKMNTSSRDCKSESFNTTQLCIPNIARNTASLIRTDDFKSQAQKAALTGESLDKMPHFIVKDFRDNKGRLQTPIHQVRDVRKLVKSSYHLFSVNGHEKEPSLAFNDSLPEKKEDISLENLNVLGHVEIKCQSVNTRNEKQTGYQSTEWKSMDRDLLLSPSQMTTARAARLNNEMEIGNGLRTEGRLETKCDLPDKKPQSEMLNQLALEKLQAAVKTMEQLYVFEKNEWKRKDGPHSSSESHMPSLVGERKGVSKVPDKSVNDYHPNKDGSPSAVSTHHDKCRKVEGRQIFKGVESSICCDDRFLPKSVQASSTSGTKNMLNPNPNIKTFTSAITALPTTATKNNCTSKHTGSRSPQLCTSSNATQTCVNRKTRANSKEVDRFTQERCSDSVDNYFREPLKSNHTTRTKEKVSNGSSLFDTTQSSTTLTPGPISHPGTRDEAEKNPTNPVTGLYSAEMPSANFYHSLPQGTPVSSQPQVYCLPPTPNIDSFQATQKKMLLDSSTGIYYLVDTPVQPASKRLFDPETGQYVDVSLPQLPMTQFSMPIPHLSHSPASFGPAYMFYPYMMTTPTVPLMHSHMSVTSGTKSVESVTSQHSEAVYGESPLIMATSRISPEFSCSQQRAPIIQPQHGFLNVNQPMVSIPLSQGPCIIAPPSFDGTTMSFMVEHK